ncbi:MAG: RHS repeat protein, partial [Burkholderiales bacterium]|nr:RHS repeat protein [Burkholderiales bacterium]
MIRYFITAIAIITFPIPGLTLTKCSHGWSEKDYSVGFGIIELALEDSFASTSPEGQTWDNSALAGGCQNYLNITGYMGRYTSSPNVTIDFYSVDEKQYFRSNPAQQCMLKGVDRNKPPVIDPTTKSAAGMWIACVNYTPPGAPPIPLPGSEPEPRNKKPAPPPLSCKREESSTPHPVFLPTGEKYLEITDWRDHGSHPLTIRRIYYSGSFSNAGTTPWRSWTHNFEQRLSIIGRDAHGPNYIVIQSGGAKQLFFTKSNGFWNNVNGNDKLEEIPSGGWRHTDQKNDLIYIYNNYGQIQQQQSRNGWTYTYTHHNNGFISSVTNAFGRKINFTYDGYSTSIKMDDKTLVSYETDGDTLGLVNYPDSTGEAYAYNSDGLLTEVKDGNGTVLNNFFYDSNGRVTKTIKPLNTSKYTITYNTDGSVKVEDPINSNRIFTFFKKNGDAKIVKLSHPSNETDFPVSTRSLDPDGNIQIETDFRGTSTSYTWESARRLPLSGTEAVGTPEARSMGIEWHPQWRLPLKVTESGRTTEYTYDERGNRLSQTVTDGTTARTTRWTYTPQSLVATQTAPNGAVTSYQYDSLGNLTQSTNALGHTQRYTHDGAGRVLTHTDPNGTLSTYTYDPRGRMLSASVGGIASHYTYTPSGQLASAQFAHGHR